MFNKMKNKRSLAAVITLVTLFIFSIVMTVVAAAQDTVMRISTSLSPTRRSFTEISLSVRDSDVTLL